MGWLIFFGLIFALNEWLYTGPNRRRLYQIRRENPQHTMRESMDQLTREVRGQVVPDYRNTRQVRFRSGFFNKNIVVDQPALDGSRHMKRNEPDLPQEVKYIKNDPGEKAVYSYRDFWNYDVESPPNVPEKQKKGQDKNKSMRVSFHGSPLK